MKPRSASASASVSAATALLLMASNPGVSSAAGWDEDSDGDLSTIQSTPSLLLLAEGLNTVAGSVGGGADSQDWITLTIPFGFELRSVELSTFNSLNDSTAFTGFAEGPTFTGSHLSAENYLGYTHFGPGNVGANLLPAMGAANLARGFTPPVPAGDYAFLIQQTGSLPTAWRFEYTVAAVPEVSAAGLGLVAMAGLLFPRRRRSR